MATNHLQGIIPTDLHSQNGDDFHIWGVIDAFLKDKQVINLHAGTLNFYRHKLRLFRDFCDGQQVTMLSQVDTTLLRDFMLKMSETHNPGGCHAIFRAVRSLLIWYGNEVEPEGWRNPIRKLKPPRLDARILEPVELSDISLLLSRCNQRDKAIILTLLDTGLRAAELLALNIEDANLLTGEIHVRCGKGGKPRTVYIGRTTRRAIRAYLRARRDNYPYLWLTKDGDRLTYWGLRAMLKRRANDAGIPAPHPHAFRRAFALNMLRSGVDVFTLQRLMGHADLQVLRRYLALTDADGRNAPSVVDCL